MSGVLLVAGTIGLIVLGGAFGPVGFLVAIFALILPGCLLAARAKRIRPN